MEFNSLDAQREACEAYITSQKHEGWHCLNVQYNDGGFSGGSLQRPDLKRLMSDISAGKLDIVVVYKVDRLTRSLADFAKLVELFDAHAVSFVSVTQSFNTTSSMGRLTLNVLLSFAQFEREVTGERIRDKIAASKKKGIRMGGPVPLGYRLHEKKLVIDETEASTVRHIFESYLRHGTLTAVMRHLDSAGIVTKRTTRKDGSIRGGVRFGKGALAHLLRNRTYVGEIIHKSSYFAGEHQAILERDTFDEVQEALTRPEEVRARRRFKAKDTFALAEKILDDRGNRMTPTVAHKNGAHYRYYVSSALTQGRHAEAGSVTRVSAQQIEDLIAAHLQWMAQTQLDLSTQETSTEQHGDQSKARGINRLPNQASPSGKPGLARQAGFPNQTGTPQQCDEPDQFGTTDQFSALGQLSALEQFNTLDQPSSPIQIRAQDFSSVDRVVVAKTSLRVTFKPDAVQHREELVIPWSPIPHRRRRAIIVPDQIDVERPIRSETRARLLLGIAKARHWLDDLITGRATDTHTIATREGCSERTVRQNLNLAFLAPNIVRQAFDGTLPDGAGITQFVDAPMAWED